MRSHSERFPDASLSLLYAPEPARFNSPAVSCGCLARDGDREAGPRGRQGPGINETPLASWVSRAKRAEKATPEDQDALIARLTAENAALKEENKELGMERDVLKHCMALWVQ